MAAVAARGGPLSTTQAPTSRARFAELRHRRTPLCARARAPRSEKLQVDQRRGGGPVPRALPLALHS